MKEHPEMLEDGKRFKAILQDTYPSERGNVNLMVTAHNAGTVGLLRGNGPKGFQVPRIINLLMDEYGIAEEKARWTAQLWADAYELFQKPEAARPKEAAPDWFEAGCSITKYTGPDTEQIVIPAQIGGLPVTCISGWQESDDGRIVRHSSFEKCTHLTSVVLPDSVTKIGENAFWCCSNLTSIIIPDGVTEIGGWAFAKCSSLTSVTIPDSVTEIGDCAFAKCSSLASIIIPIGVTEIGKFAFVECSSLTSIIIPNGVTEIGEWAFWNCNSLTSIIIPDGVTEIRDFTFNDCSSLTSIIIPDSVKKIGVLTFFSCPSLTIHAPAGSVAERYARAKNIPFKPIR